MEVLFRTRHGSHLYGLAHAGSDEDWFTVVTKKEGSTAHTRKRYARHTIIDGQDSVVVDFGTWLVGCDKGVPQYLEAMFSQSAEIDLIRPFRMGYRVHTPVYDTYLRTMKSFALGEGYKQKRHALRLAFNMRDLRQHSRFNPRLTEQQIEYINICADMDADDVYDLAKSIAWS